MRSKIPCCFLGLLCQLASQASAEVRMSPDYVVHADVVSAGGGISISGDYRNEGSVAGFAGNSSAVGMSLQLGHGYVNQRSEAMKLTVTAQPFIVNEGGTAQLTATATMDDESLVSLLGPDVTWKVVNGPIKRVNEAGAIEMGFVYQITVAELQGLFAGATGAAILVVLDVGHDDFADYAGDGLDDAWQVFYFGEHNAQALGTRDPDADGFTNVAEWMAGTDPLDPLSHLRFWASRPATPTWPIQISFTPCRADRVYTVERQTHLNSEFIPLVESPVRLESSEGILTDRTATNRTGFYRLRISKP